MKKSITIIIAAALLWGCSPKIIPVQRDTVTVIKTEIVERLVRDTVHITLPQDSTSTVTTDTTSTLTIRAATSTATVSNGTLTHTLHSNPSYKPEVEIVYKDRVEYRDTTIYVNHVDTVEVEKQLNGWQKTMMSGGYVLLGAVVLLIVLGVLKWRKVI